MSKKYNNRSYCYGFKSDKCGYPFKVSRAFRVTLTEDGGDIIAEISGTANDILKVVRDIQGEGYYPSVMFRERGGVWHGYTLRSNRRYTITFNQSRVGEYSIYRNRVEV